MAPEPKPVPYDELVEGTLYEVRARFGGGNVQLALPYRGRNDHGRHVFADGPNGIEFRDTMWPRPLVYRFEDTM